MRFISSQFRFSLSRQISSDSRHSAKPLVAIGHVNTPLLSAVHAFCMKRVVHESTLAGLREPSAACQLFRSVRRLHGAGKGFHFLGFGSQFAEPAFPRAAISRRSLYEFRGAPKRVCIVQAGFSLREMIYSAQTAAPGARTNFESRRAASGRPIFLGLWRKEVFSS